MSEESRENQSADNRASRVHLAAAHMPLTAYGSLSFTQRKNEANDAWETTYRLHLMDITSHRLVPHLLGVSGGECDHLACEMVMLNSLTAGYMVTMGWRNDHSTQLAVGLLAEQGYEIS